MAGLWRGSFGVAWICSTRSTKALGSQPDLVRLRRDLSAGRGWRMSLAYGVMVRSAGWLWQRANQYLEFEKSPSRRCTMACQKENDSSLDFWAIWWLWSRASCQSHRPASMASAWRWDLMGVVRS